MGLLGRAGRESGESGRESGDSDGGDIIRSLLVPRSGRVSWSTGQGQGGAWLWRSTLGLCPPQLSFLLLL